jgi:molybdopterin-guanine dinucleotide biosynthesis protein A
MKIAGVIIAGGRSRRMGAEKALTTVAGKPILQHIVERIAPQVDALALNTNGDPVRYLPIGIPVIADMRTDIGTPLAGLHAGLHWTVSQGLDAMLSLPSDCPFLPRDLTARLGAGTLPSIASSGGQRHVLTGLWPSSLLATLDTALAEGGLFRVKDWAALVQVRHVEWTAVPVDPFFNVNTPEELAEANRIAAELAP